MAKLDWNSAPDPFAGAPSPGGIGSEFKSGVHSAEAALSAIPASMGSDAALQNMQEQQRLSANYGALAARAGVPQTPGDIHGPVDLLKFAGGQVVSATPQLAAVGIGGLVGGPGGAAAAAAPMAFGGNLATQYAQKGKFDVPSAAALAAPEAALNAVAPEARLFQRGATGAIAAETGSRIGNVVARGGITALSQGGVGAGLAELNELAKKSVDPDYDLASSEALSEVGAGALGGAVAGGLIGGVHGAFHTPEDIASHDVPDVTTSPDAAPHDPYDLLNSPTFARRGGQTGVDGLPVPNPSGQGDLFSGEIRGGRGDQRPSEAEAGDVGLTQQDAIDGLQAMHNEATAALQQHQLAEQAEPGQHADAIAQLQQQLDTIKGHLDVLGATPNDDAAQRSLFQKPDDPLVRMGTGLDVQPPTPNPDATILPANPAPQPNPSAKLIVPPRETVGDQLIAAQKARTAGQVPNAEQAALLRRPPEPANPNAQVITPDVKPGFQLTPDRRAFGEPEPSASLELQPTEAPNPAQRELDLAHSEPTPALPAPDQNTVDMFRGTPNADWQTRMRLAWKDQSDGSLQGFHKSMKDALAAGSEEDAAAAIRDKADNPSTGTLHRKLDAVHRALTGESIEEFHTREAATPVNPVEAEPHVGSEAPPPEEHAAPVEEAAVPKADEAAEVKPIRKSQDQKRAEDAAQLQSILDRLETAKTEPEYQSIADDLWRHSQEAQTAQGHDLAQEALHDPQNGFTEHHILQAEQNHDNAEMARVIKWSDAKVNRADVAAHAPIAGIEHGTPRNGADVVAQIARTGKDPYVKQAMQHVMRNVDLSKVEVQRNAAGDELHPAIAEAFNDNAQGAIARYPDGRMVVHLAPDAGEEATAHELVHAATLAALDDPAKAAPFKALMEEVKQRLAGSDNPDAKLFEKYALGDVKEFVAYASTNQRMIGLMKSLDVPGKATLWDKLKAAIQKALGVPKMMLDKLLGKEPHGHIVEGVHARFESQFQRLLETRDEDTAAHAAEIKFHALGGSPDTIVGGLKEAGETLWDSVKGVASKGMLGAMPTHAIVDAFKHQLRSLPDVQHAIEDRTVRQHELARGGAEVHDALLAAFKDQKSLDRLHSVFEDSQTAMIDPRTEPMDRVQAYLKVAQEKLTRLPKDATPLDRMRAEDHLKRAAAGARLKDNWNRMSEPEKKAFGLAVEKMKASMQARQDAANAILLRSRDQFHDPVLDQMRADGASPEAIDKQIIDTYGKEFKTLDGAYAPLKRFGEWAVVRTSPEYRQAEAELRDARIAAAGERGAEGGKVSPATSDRLRNAQEMMQLMSRDGQHREVTFHESSAAAQKAKDEAVRQYPEHDVQRFTRNEYGRQVTAANGATINKIMEAVGKELPPGLRDNVQSLIRDMYVDALPDGSFLQTQQMRHGVAGYSTDFSRSILDSLLRDSFQISTLEHSEKIGQAMRALDDERRNVGTDNANNIHDTIAARIDASTQFKNFARWEQRISEVTHAMYLGMSPGFLLMNMMQMPMITVPMLHARFGMGKVEAPLTKAISDVWDAIRKGRLEPEQGRFTEEEKQVLTRLQNLGILNMTQMHDTAQTARSSHIIDPKTLGEKGTKGWEAAKHIVNMPAQYVETVNRAASALAAYRLAREGKNRFGPMDHGAAMDYAAKIVRDSHVDYGATNNPAWMKNGFMPGSRLLFQFKKYWLNMLSMVSVNMWDAFGHHGDIKGLRNDLADSSLSPEKMAEKQAMLQQLMERRSVARRTLAGLYGMHLLHTGALGMPFVGAGITLANIMRSWYSDPEDKVDTESDLRNYVANAFGADASDTLFHGIWSGLFGMGISQRIGMGDLASPIHVFNADKLNGKDYGKELLIGALGPTVGLSLNMVDAYKQFEAGNYERGTEKLLPKMAGDVLKASRREIDGGEVSPAGKMVTPTTEGDAIKQALGIMPERIANAYAARNAEAVAKQTFDATRNGLIKQAAQASKDGDYEGKQQAMDAIKAFNERNPGRGLSISQGDVLKATNAMTKPPRPPSAAVKERNARFAEEGDFAKEE